MEDDQHQGVVPVVLFAGPIAQLVELPAHNRLVPGSSPGGPTISLEDW